MSQAAHVYKVKRYCLLCVVFFMTKLISFCYTVEYRFLPLTSRLVFVKLIDSTWYKNLKLRAHRIIMIHPYSTRWNLTIQKTWQRIKSLCLPNANNGYREVIDPPRIDWFDTQYQSLIFSFILETHVCRIWIFPSFFKKHQHLRARLIRSLESNWQVSALYD